MKKSSLVKLITFTVLCALCMLGLTFLPAASLTKVKAASSSLYDPGPGKTLQLIGQDYTSDYQDYVTAAGRAPAGGSIYGDIYSGGLDNSSQSLLNYIGTTYPQAYVEVGMSWKDALAQHGYTGYAAGYTMELDIVNHKYDSQIDSWATLFKNWPRLKFLLRLDYEVSLNIHANSNPNALDPSSFKPQAYQNAFNYVAARIRNTDQVSNVAFVYHPVRGITDAQELYPGSQYVDWIGVSVFNNDVCLDDNGTSNCTGQQIDPNLAQVLQFGQNQGKPLMISESSVQNPYDATSSGFENYLGRVFSAISTYDIRAFVYINYNWAAHGWTGGFANTDSRVQRDPTVLSYWLQTLSSPRYITYSGSGGTPTPTPTMGGSTPTPTPSGGSITIPGTVATNIGAIANGSPRSWTVNVTTAGNYRFDISSNSSQNSQLITIALNGSSLQLAIDSGKTISAYFNGVSTGSHTFTITANSSSVSLSTITAQTY